MKLREAKDIATINALLDDYNAYYKTNFFWGVMIIVFFNIPVIIYSVIVILRDVFGLLQDVDILRKKHPTEKHVYKDEENEFSPYKQKIIDQKQEEEANKN